MFKNMKSQIKTSIKLSLVGLIFGLYGCGQSGGSLSGSYACGKTIWQFTKDGSATSSDGIRPMSYKIEDNYIYILTPANQWVPLLKKVQGTIARNMDGTGFNASPCEKL